MARVLITGAAGFIGSHLADHFLKAGHEVQALDDFSTGRKENISSFVDRCEFITGDICDAETIRRACDGCAWVVHHAALPSVPYSVEHPAEVHRVNATGTLEVLLAARDAGVRRVVYAASSSAYGDAPGLPKTENMAPQPQSPYALTKLMGEYYLTLFAELYEMSTVSLRYFNVFGPRQNPRSQYAAVIPAFITAMLRGEALTVYGDGEQSRDFTFVGDVAAAVLQACLATALEGEVLNVAGGRAFSLNGLLRELERLIGQPAQARYEAPRQGDIKHSLADISRARALLGFEPRVSFPEGLRQTVEWFRQNGGSPG